MGTGSPISSTKISPPRLVTPMTLGGFTALSVDMNTKVPNAVAERRSGEPPGRGGTLHARLARIGAPPPMLEFAIMLVPV